MKETLLPAGSFIVDRDLKKVGWTTKPRSGIYLCHRDVFDLPRSERYQGCCGPDGDLQNVLDPDTMNPIAYEFADCWHSHYIRFARGDYSLQEESPEDPKCLVGYVKYRGDCYLVGAACGRTDEEALARLMPLAQKQLEQQAGYAPDYHEIFQSPIETESASTFLSRRRPKWFF